MSQRRNHHKCKDCGVDTARIGEHYMLKDSVWYSAYAHERGMLCIGCLEKRLGRQLTKADFNDSHVNRPAPGKVFSMRLMSRLA